METKNIHDKYSNYHYCIVRECKSTSIRNPRKLWIKLPRCKNMRYTWLKLAKRNPFALSTKTMHYFCEDHFNLENDMVNYMQYKMGLAKQIRMHAHCVPTKFECLADNKHKQEHESRDKVFKNGMWPFKLYTSLNVDLPNEEDAISSDSDEDELYSRAMQETQCNAEDVEAMKAEQEFEHATCQAVEHYDHKGSRSRKPEYQLFESPDIKEEVHKEFMAFQEDETIQGEGKTTQERDKTTQEGDNTTEEEDKTTQELDKTTQEEEISTLYGCHDYTVPDMNDKLHEGFTCHVCSGHISGFRFRCVQCARDMCSSCSGARDHRPHYVLRVPPHKPQDEVNFILQKLRDQLWTAEEDVRTETVIIKEECEVFEHSLTEDPVIKAESIDEEEQTSEVQRHLMINSPPVKETPSFSHFVCPSETPNVSVKEKKQTPASSETKTKNTAERIQRTHPNRTDEKRAKM